MITAKDRKVMIKAGSYAAVIFLFWALIYFPAHKKCTALKSDFETVRAQISGIESRGGERGRDIAQMAGSLQRDFELVRNKIPYKEEESLELIAKEAARSGVAIASINPSQRRPMLDAQNNQVFMEGVQCFEIPIAIEMKGGYRSIGEYLRVLREGPSVLVKVEDINIERAGGAAGQLKARADIILVVAGAG